MKTYKTLLATKYLVLPLIASYLRSGFASNVSIDTNPDQSESPLQVRSGSKLICTALELLGLVLTLLVPVLKPMPLLKIETGTMSFLSVHVPELWLLHLSET